MHLRLPLLRLAVAGALLGAVVAGPSRAVAAPDGPVETFGEGDLPGIPPEGTPPADPDTVAREIGLGLRCPVCQGLSVADSTSPTAVNMQRRIRELVARGYTEVQIDDFFVEKYGEWVLLEPRGDGLNQLVWLGPALAFALGLGLAGTFVLRGSPPEPDTGADRRASSGALGGDLEGDPYAAALLSEVDDDA